MAYVLERVNTAPYPMRMDVTVGAPATLVAEQLSVRMANVEPIDDTRCRVRSGMTDMRVAALKLIALEAPLTVHEPPALAAHLHEISCRLTTGVVATPG